MSRPVLTGPRYALLLETLMQDIAAGRFAVGELLPTEAQFSGSYGVSRATVREALRRLREQGLVESAQGIGTRVIARRPRPTYEMAVRSMADLMGYGGPTRLEIRARDWVTVEGTLAAQLGDGSGQEMMRLSGVRHALGPAPRTLSAVEMFVPAAYAAAAEHPDVGQTPIYRLIEQRWRVPVIDMHQEISAVPLRPEAAAVLGVRAGGPGLRLVRRFYGPKGALLEATVNIHAAAPAFTYAIRLTAPG